VLILRVHGLGRTPISLFGLAAELRRSGHRTRFFGYSPTFEPLTHIVKRLGALLHELARRKPIGLVGHSLGGVLLRLAIPTVPHLQVHHLVLLGAPAVPARMARVAWRWFAPFRLLTGGCGRFLSAPEPYTALPEPRVPYTVIAGTAGPRGAWSPFGRVPNDGIVAVSETRIGSAEPVTVAAIHTVLMDSVDVRRRISTIMVEE
jgi:hypothetical protein